jgi:hypothetical protein
MESIGVFSGNMNSLQVMENSSYRRSSYRSSTVYALLCVAKSTKRTGDVKRDFTRDPIQRLINNPKRKQRFFCKQHFLFILKVRQK